MTALPFPTAMQKVLSGELRILQLVETTSKLSATGQLNLARQLYKSWIESNREHPQLFIAYFNSSALDTQAGDSDAATESLKQAIALNPDFMPAYINLG